jgi:hypothetical protein
MSTESVETVTAFLQARIAEDEFNADVTAVPHASLVQIAPGVQVWHTFGATVKLDELHSLKGQWVVKTDPDRLHAECAAKRRLLDLAEQLGGEARDSILRAIAAPYSAYRGFPDEWRS